MEPSLDDDLGPAFEPAVLTNRQPDLESEPDDGLITYMALKDDDLGLAQRACEELYRRHARTLIGWCLKNRAETFGKDAKDFVNATFLKAYDKAATFKFSTGATLEVRRFKVRRWLFQILYRLFLDGRRSEQCEPILRSDDNEDGLLLDAPNPETEPNTSDVSPARKNLVLKFLQSVEPIDKAILKATAQYWSSISGKTVVPRHVRQALCREFKLTENSLNVRRFRALNNLKQFILENERSKHENTTETR